MVNRRQLLKLSAVGSVFFSVPLAYSASKITMAYNTGNPIGSTSPKDLSDNARSLDSLVNGVNPSYPDRRGVPRKSWSGMEGAFNADQARRDSEFDTYQAARVAEFHEFLKSSGFETAVDYVAGLEITRPTQVLRIGGELYRAKDASLPFTTSAWPADAAKLLAIGDAALRQEMAAHGADMTAFVDPRSPAYLKTVSDIINMVPVNVLRLVPKTQHSALNSGTGTFALAAPINGLIFDMNAVGGGEINLTHGKHMIESYIETLSNVAVEGLGDNSVIKGMFASPVNRMISSPAGVLQYNVKLKKFKVDRSAVNTEHGIILGGIDGLTIDDVTVDGFCPVVDSGAIGISPFDEFAAVQSRNVAVKNCKINKPNNFGIAYGNVSGGTLSKNLFTDAWREAIGLECWGNSSAVEDIVVSENILRMSTSVANHHVGSIGPAILIGGAGQTYGGVTRRCKLKGNIITIDNPAGVQAYGGIFVIGGNADAYAAEDIELEGNSIYNAPAQAIGIGALGSVQRRIISRGNTIFNPNNSNNGYSAIHLRNAQDCVFQGDVVVGSKHVYSVFEDVGSTGNTFLDVVPGAPTTGKFYRSSSASIYRDPTGNQTLGGHQFQESKIIANGAAATFTARANPNRGLYSIVTSSGAYAILCFNSTFAPVVIAKSVDMAVGATDLGTAASFSIYPAGPSTVAVTNRNGAAQNVTILSLNAN